MQIELKGIFSPELNEPGMPEDPRCCAVFMSADIGERGTPAADQFNFHVVTPSYLLAHPEVRWGRGYLLMPEFSWREVSRMLERLVSGISAENWSVACRELSRYLDWEFDGYDA